MAQPKRKPATKQAAKKPAAKRKPAAPTPQVNRMTTTATSPETENPPVEEREETQEDRDAAGAARKEHVLTPGKPLPPEEYEPERVELEHAGFDHYAAEEQRQDELADQRMEHNRRTGDSSLSRKGTWS